jgi:hypothetical protein
MFVRNTAAKLGLEARLPRVEAQLQGIQSGTAPARWLAGATLP